MPAPPGETSNAHIAWSYFRDGGYMQTPIVVGDVSVVKAGPTYELLATNPLGEVAMATPAISEGTFLFRTRGHLVAVGGR